MREGEQRTRTEYVRTPGMKDGVNSGRDSFSCSHFFSFGPLLCCRLSQSTGFTPERDATRHAFYNRTNPPSSSSLSSSSFWHVMSAAGTLVKVVVPPSSDAHYCNGFSSLSSSACSLTCKARRTCFSAPRYIILRRTGAVSSQMNALFSEMPMICF